MSDDLDERIDRAIGAEKSSALQRYRLHPIALHPSAAEQSGARPQARWMPPGTYRLAGAAAVISVLGLLVVWRHERPSSAPGISSRTIERVLSAANAQPRPASAGIPPPGGPGDSETAWTIQRVFCRMQLLQYPAQDRGAAVLQAFSHVQASPRPAAAWVEGPRPGLDQRMEQLVSSNAVARVLSGIGR